jgi:hypothetical protein
MSKMTKGEKQARFAKGAALRGSAPGRIGGPGIPEQFILP